jgi:hypothetical protein
LMTVTTMTFRCCLSRIPYRSDTKDIIHDCSAVASVMSSTSGRVASAPPWSRCKHQLTLSILNVNY